MEKARPIRERELLLGTMQSDEKLRHAYRGFIDPQIDGALKSHGYIEDRTAPRHISVNGADRSTRPLSRAYLDSFQAPFDGIKISSTYDIAEGEEILTQSTVGLSRIGGFSISQLASVGTRYKFTNEKANSRLPALSMDISEEDANDILQDIRSHTVLGYSSADSIVPYAEVIAELEHLHPVLTVNQRAQYQLLTTDENYGDVQMKIGKSFELHHAEKDRLVARRARNVSRFFEMVTKLPMGDGVVTLGSHYRSGGETTLKVTAAIDSETYSEREKIELYKKFLTEHQEEDVLKFARGVLRHLSKIQDPNSDIIRIG